MIKPSNFLILTLLLCFIIPCKSFSWSEKGHRIIAKIAEERLSAKARKGIKEILGKESLPQVSTWMDFIRSDHNLDFSNSYHYVELEEGKGYLESKKDPKGDLVRAILFYEDLLRDKKSAKEDKEIALKFLVHMIGDVHQPLHVGTKNDMGANKVWVKWFDESTNLHKLWDEGLIEFQKLSYTEYVSFIDKIGESQQRDWNKTSLLDWVEESRIISDKLHEGLRVYKKHRLSYTYNYEYLELLNERLKQAGVRLAFFLNNIFDGRKNVDSDKIRETLGSEPNYGLPGRSK